MNDSELYALGARLGAALKRDHTFITCAESCTGGWVAKTITDVS
ncbi:nicotinamide-nucleotide amidase, partial [Sodalis-like symbiont of Bactericera trigonica]